MTSLPPIPPWDSLHPLIIHFPIALLLIAPLFLVVGAILRPDKGRPLLLAALALMVLGTVGAWVAVETGEAAGEIADRNPQVNSVILRHEHLAETTRATFTTLTVIFALILFVPRLFKREASRIFSTALPLVFLIAYGAGAVLLANTAHQGGRLVHELGIAAPMPDAAPSLTPATEPAGDESED